MKKRPPCCFVNMKKEYAFCQVCLHNYVCDINMVYSALGTFFFPESPFSDFI